MKYAAKIMQSRPLGRAVTVPAFKQRRRAMPAALERAVFTSEVSPYTAEDGHINSGLATSQGKDFAPCCFKDTFAIAGTITGAGSTLLPRIQSVSKVNSPLVDVAIRCGLWPVAKTQMNEFAYGLDGRNPHFGDCPHPFLSNRLSGGSSSGSAWAVAQGMVSVGFGTDTGGSIRVPSAFCGLWGLRLVPGHWTKSGCFPLAPSFDTVGWMTADFNTMAEVSTALLGLEAADRPVEPPLRIANLSPPSGSVAEAFGEPFSAPNVSTEVVRADLATAFTVLQSCEALEVHRAWLAPYRAEYDPVVWARISRAGQWTASDIAAARKLRLAAKEAFAKLFNQWDVLLLPVWEKGPPMISGMDEHFRQRLLINMAPASICGLAVLTIPWGTDRENPLGLQCVLPPGRWPLVLRRLFKVMEARAS